jgi:protein TonB
MVADGSPAKSFHGDVRGSSSTKRSIGRSISSPRASAEAAAEAVKVQPVYPEIARQAGVQGVVILAAKTDETGRVVDLIVLRSIPLLDQAAIDAVRQWVYEPLVVDGKAVTAVFNVTVHFQLK